jgi:hypothetical protein
MEQDSGHARSPFDITSNSPSGSNWPPAATSATPDESPVDDAQQPPVVEARDDEPAGPADEAEPAQPTKHAESAPMTGWPAFGSSLGLESAWDRADTPEESGETVDRDGDQQQVEDAIASWSSFKPAYDPYEPISAPEPTAYASADSKQSTDEPASVEDSAIDSPAQDLSDEPAAVDVDDRSVEPLTEIELDEAQPTPAAAGATTSDGSLARATQLVDELRQLLPTLSAVRGVGNASTESVAAELERVRNEHSLQGETFSSLRAAVATAQARPRDVDIMLDLVGRAGAMGDMIAAFDRYQTAIDAAIKALRGEAEDEPAPRW